MFRHPAWLIYILPIVLASASDYGSVLLVLSLVTKSVFIADPALPIQGAIGADFFPSCTATVIQTPPFLMLTEGVTGKILSASVITGMRFCTDTLNNSACSFSRGA